MDEQYEPFLYSVGGCKSMYDGSIAYSDINLENLYQDILHMCQIDNRDRETTGNIPPLDKPSSPQEEKPGYDSSSVQHGTVSNHTANLHIETAIGQILDTPISSAHGLLKGPEGRPLGVEVAMNSCNKGESSTADSQEEYVPKKLQTIVEHPEHDAGLPEILELDDTSCAVLDVVNAYSTDDDGFEFYYGDDQLVDNSLLLLPTIRKPISTSQTATISRRAEIRSIVPSTHGGEVPTNGTPSGPAPDKPLPPLPVESRGRSPLARTLLPKAESYLNTVPHQSFLHLHDVEKRKIPRLQAVNSFLTTNGFGPNHFSDQGHGLYELEGEDPTESLIHPALRRPENSPFAIKPNVHMEAGHSPRSPSMLPNNSQQERMYASLTDLEMISPFLPASYPSSYLHSPSTSDPARPSIVFSDPGPERARTFASSQQIARSSLDSKPFNIPPSVRALPSPPSPPHRLGYLSNDQELQRMYASALDKMNDMHRFTSLAASDSKLQKIIDRGCDSGIPPGPAVELNITGEHTMAGRNLMKKSATRLRKMANMDINVTPRHSTSTPSSTASYHYNASSEFSSDFAMGGLRRASIDDTSRSKLAAMGYFTPVSSTQVSPVDRGVGASQLRYDKKGTLIEDRGKLDLRSRLKRRKPSFNEIINRGKGIFRSPSKDVGVAMLKSPTKEKVERRGSEGQQAVNASPRFQKDLKDLRKELKIIPNDGSFGDYHVFRDE